MAHFEIFRIISLGVFALLMGFFSAVPIGAAQVEAAKRALHNHLLSAFILILGTASADLMYGCIAFYGLAPYLENKTVVAVFELICVFILWVLAFLTIRQSSKPHITHIELAILQSKRLSFVTGFLLGISNPLMIFWWLVGAKIVRDLGIIHVFSILYSSVFLFFALLGMVTYLTSLSLILHWAHKFISPKVIQKINFTLGIILIILSLYFLFTALKTLIH